MPPHVHVHAEGKLAAWVETRASWAAGVWVVKGEAMVAGWWMSLIEQNKQS